jgi:hypothetical protein
MQQPSVKVGIVIIMTVAANISFKWGLPYPTSRHREVSRLRAFGVVLGSTNTVATLMGRAEDLGQGAQHAPEHGRCWHEAIVNVIVALSLPKVTVSLIPSSFLPLPSYSVASPPRTPSLPSVRHPRSRRRGRPFLRQHTPGPEAGNRTKNKVRSNTEPNRTKNKVRSKTP